MVRVHSTHHDATDLYIDHTAAHHVRLLYETVRNNAHRIGSTGTMFPPEYRGNLFVAYHGSWDRSVPTGYKVVRLVAQDGNVVGGRHDFITGWLQGRNDWGRPVGLQVGKYGELYITDDSGGRVYRVAYGR